MAPDAPRWYVTATNVLSNRGAVERDPNLVKRLRRYAGLVRASVITVAEIRRGLLLLEVKAAVLTDRKVKAREQARLARKRAWYDEVTGRFADPVSVKQVVAWNS